MNVSLLEPLATLSLHCSIRLLDEGIEGTHSTTGSRFDPDSFENCSVNYDILELSLDLIRKV